jgi:hypothetical protein
LADEAGSHRFLAVVIWTKGISCELTPITATAIAQSFVILTTACFAGRRIKEWPAA